MWARAFGLRQHSAKPHKLADMRGFTRGAPPHFSAGAGMLVLGEKLPAMWWILLNG